MKVIIVGGAGFIGANAAARFLKRNDEVVIIDDLSKSGSDQNLAWLASIGSVEHARVDVRDFDSVNNVFSMHSGASLVLHLAGQVAVTTSIRDPLTDFAVNAGGTLNVLEAMRLHSMAATLIFASTNKVYGALSDVELLEGAGAYSFANLPNGVGEDRQLDFHSPYGCSKGAADQYVRDYARIYGLRTVVFRQSCIYGPHQSGAEDQGWVAWFTICAQTGRTISIFGDGKQVRDMLHVDDLLDAFDSAHRRIGDVAGRIYNIGGGPSNALSLLQLVAFLESRSNTGIRLHYADWRPGDQKVFVTDTRRAMKDLHWAPRVGTDEGLARLWDWVGQNVEAFA